MREQSQFLVPSVSVSKATNKLPADEDRVKPGAYREACQVFGGRPAWAQLFEDEDLEELSTPNAQNSLIWNDAFESDEEDGNLSIWKNSPKRHWPQQLCCFFGLMALLSVSVVITFSVLLSINKESNEDVAAAYAMHSWKDMADLCKEGIRIDIVSLLAVGVRERYEKLRNEFRETFGLGETFSCSPQTQALISISMIMSSASNGNGMGDILTQYALSVFFFGANGREWNSNQGWIEDADFCNWYGLTCSESEEVVEIHFDNNNLLGSLSDELYLLESLKKVTLIERKFDGTLSSMIGKLTNLELLQFWGSGLMQRPLPPEIGKLTKLASLYLHDYARGLLPREIGLLTSLEKLDLDRVQYINIATEIALLTNLKELRIVGTFVGSFPTGIWFLPLLEELIVQPFQSAQIETHIPAIAFENNTSWKIIQVQDTAIEGPIPTTIGYLQELRILALPRNNLELSIPSEIGLCTKLSRIDLESNYLTGTIPSELSNLVSTETIMLKGNKLTGALPFELGGLDSLRELYLSDNRLRLNGIPESYVALTNLETLDLSRQSSKVFAGLFPTGICEIGSTITKQLTVSITCGGNVEYPNAVRRRCESKSCCSCESGPIIP